MATLALNDSRPAKVWEVIRRALTDDPTYDTAGISLVFYDGTIQPTADLQTFPGPAVRFSPNTGAHRWADQASVGYPLSVDIEVALVVPDSADMLNLQLALLASLNTISTNLQQDLRDAGADTGLILFDQPFHSYGDFNKDGRMRAKGRFYLDILDTLG